MSLSFVWRPRLMRSDPWANSFVRPMAVRTCDVSTLAEEQAEPVEQAIPSMSRLRIIPSPSTPLAEKLMLFGSRPRGMAVQANPGEPLEQARIKRSRIAVSLAVSSVSSAPPAPRPSRKPTIPGTFKVEARRPPSCSPPFINVQIRVPCRI